MSRQNLTLIIFIIIVHYGWSNGWSQVKYYSPENIYRFAEHLYQNGDYTRAAGEFQRYLFSFDSSMNHDSLLYKIGLCFQLGHHPTSAVRYYQKVINSAAKNNFFDRAHYQIAYTYFAQEEYEKSIEYIRNNNLALSPGLAQLKMNQLLGINYLYQKRWQTASDHFSALMQNQQDGDIDPFTGELNKYATQGTKLPRKNKLLAGLLSAIIPGSGKMYAGRFSDGFYSLILVGVTFWQAYEGFHKDGFRSVKGWIYGPMGTIFYLGNIYGSVVAVKLINERTENNFIQKININFTWY